MKSQALLARSNSLLRRSTLQRNTQLPGPLHSLCIVHRYKRHRAAAPAFIKSRLYSTAPPPSSPATDLPEPVELPEEFVELLNQNIAAHKELHEATEESDKPASSINGNGAKFRRSRGQASGPKEAEEPIVFPENLKVLWSHEEGLLGSQETPSHLLPPPEIFEEALDNLLITLHPHNQQKAAFPSGSSGRPVEPTLGLYCPLEGGDYVIDATVHELAFRTGAEVVVLDAVQLAAGEWGSFGKAATCLNLPKNPLHFSSPPPPPVHVDSAPSSRAQRSQDEDAEDMEGFFLSPAPRLALRAAGLIPSRQTITSSSRRAAPPSKLEQFFDALVNLPSEDASVSSSSSDPARPRLIYIRDFPTLAASSSTWYPALLKAVRERRKGNDTRPGAVSPVTIIFGMTPPLAPSGDASSTGSRNLISLLMNRMASPPQMVPGNKHDLVHDWSESDVAESAREKRLKTRLKKWEKHPTGLQDEFPKLSLDDDGESPGLRPDVVVVGPGGPASSILNGPLNLGDGPGDAENDKSGQFFRSSVIVPSTRSHAQEKESRIARRREINELTIRMGIGAVGGYIDDRPASYFLEPLDLEARERDSGVLPAMDMWDDWGNRIEVWSNVRKIADRAMGSMLAARQPSTAVVPDFIQTSTSQEVTPVPWYAVISAWKGFATVKDTRKAWVKQAGKHTTSTREEHAHPPPDEATPALDKVIEGVKNDPDLDHHEQRLLSSTVHTTFSQVHLPPTTIDAVRTIVSLPLLYPDAFRQGILKEHGLTGCLLFGPPGTGKTLVVRALAKEAGCRMLAISPSDVMDMYVGEGEKLVRAVFSLARRLSPCVVFLDEIDALFGARMSARESGSAFAHRGVITEFMQEMDGLKSSKDDNVIVIGATNRPFDLDDAVLRRLPRRLLVDLPVENDRREILKILLRDEDLADDISIDNLAKRTDGFSGSDLKHLCVSAALDAVKENLDLPWAPRSSPTSTASTGGGEASPSATNSLHATSTDQNATPTTADVDATESLLSEVPPPMDSPLATTENSPSDVDTEKIEPLPPIVRSLHLRNFEQALKEITPTSSESLGSLADLRKWNDEFGEGRKDKKRRQVWGKGRFGFVKEVAQKGEEGRVTIGATSSATSPSSASS